MLYLRLVCWTFVWWLKFNILEASEEKTDDHSHLIVNKPGKEQSPINIITHTAIKKHFPYLYCHYKHPFNTAIAELTNSGFTIVVKLSEDTLDIPSVVGGPLFHSTYLFEQMHLHWNIDNHGSEHEVNKKKFALEVHMVHFKKKYKSFQEAQQYRDGVCVIGVFGKISPNDNPQIDHFIKDLELLRDINSTIIRDFRMEFSWIKDIAQKQHYYTYHGSLTTPPFTECVIWILFTHTFMISEEQLSQFRTLHGKDGHLIKANDREIQPSNNRPIEYVN